MSTRDLKNMVKEEKSLDPAARTATADGAGVDVRDFDSAILVVYAGVVTDGTHTPKLQESDDNSTFNDVAALDQEGTLVALTTSSIQRVGYKGSKRFLRGRIEVTGGPSTGAVAAAAVVSGHPHATPTQ